MPVDMSKYPDNWQEIRARILRRAGGQGDDPRVGACCEWCKLRNYEVGYRDELGDFIPYENSYVPDDEDMPWPSYKAAKSFADMLNLDKIEKWVVVVLTIAHLDDPDPMNCNDDNLAALCQRCHNNYDNKMRKGNAARTRRKQRIEAGQMAFELANEKE